MSANTFDQACTACPRLAAFLREVRRAHPQYYALPVAPFGDPRARLLVVGLAPGMHGANRTGRPFTGDFAGVLLFETLHKFGFADRIGTAEPDDGLTLRDVRITNAVKCLPPQNKPDAAEMRRCNGYLAAEIAAQPPRVILALGRIAHEAVLAAVGAKRSDFPFGRHAQHALANGMQLVDSYHCSRYNTQTRRLTAAMFEAVFADIAILLAP